VVEKESKKYTAFLSHLGQFEFCRALFGIRTVPSPLIRAVSFILAKNEGPLIKSTLVYVDNVLCYSGSIDEHFKHLREIFQRFQEIKMKLNAKKCSFLLPEIVFLGNKFNANGISPDLDKVKAMLEFPVPTNQKKLKRALGMFQFYKKYIPENSTIIVPLNILLLKNALF